MTRCAMGSATKHKQKHKGKNKHKDDNKSKNKPESGERAVVVVTAPTPSFLGLLNAVAVAETEAECYLLAWAATTDDDDLAEVLRFVAMREGEHGKAFAKRMLELGYAVRWPDSSRVETKVAMVQSSMTDLEKFDALGSGRKPGGPDVFETFFADKTIDPITGGLLGRYIAEERDSSRLLYQARRRVKKGC